MAANNYLEKKWRNVFRFRDTTGDGSLSREDFELVSSRLIEKNGLTGEKAGQIKERLDAGWKDYYDFFGGSKAELSEADFLKASREMYSKRGDAWRQAINIYAAGCFDVIDADGDGVMTVDELDAYYQAYQVNNRKFVEEVFRQIDLDGNGTISKEEFVAAHVNYFFDSTPGRDIPVLFDVDKARA